MTDDHRLEATTLVERLRENPREAFEEMVRLYQADVRVLAIRHLGRTPAADDVAQQVFVAIYGSLPSFRGEGSLRAWVIGITMNKIRAHIRTEVQQRDKLDRSIPMELLESAATTWDADPFAHESAEEDLDALRDCLIRLEERQRQMIEAFYFRNQSAESIARELKQSAGSVRMLLRRIRQRLAKCIRKKAQFQRSNHDQ